MTMTSLDMLPGTPRTLADYPELLSACVLGVNDGRRRAYWSIKGVRNMVSTTPLMRCRHTIRFRRSRRLWIPLAKVSLVAWRASSAPIRYVLRARMAKKATPSIGPFHQLLRFLRKVVQPKLWLAKSLQFLPRLTPSLRKKTMHCRTWRMFYVELYLLGVCTR